MNYIIVTKKEFNHYQLSTHRNNKIIDFWRGIIKKMPKDLLTEIRASRTDLVYIEEGEFELKGYKPYIFKTQNAQSKLEKYLNKYVVYVMDDSGRTFNWKEDMQEKLENKPVKGRQHKK